MGPRVLEDSMSVIYCTDCPATSATALISVEDELCNECAQIRRDEDNA